MKNIQDVLREKETEVEKLTREVKVLRVAARILEDESPSQPGRAAEPMSRRPDTAFISLEGGTVPPAADGDVSPW
jgi:hypothetical protein